MIEGRLIERSANPGEHVEQLRALPTPKAGVHGAFLTVDLPPYPLQGLHSSLGKPQGLKSLVQLPTNPPHEAALLQTANTQ